MVREIYATGHIATIRMTTTIAITLAIIILIILHNNNNGNHHLLIISAKHSAKCLILSGVLQRQ